MSEQSVRSSTRVKYSMYLRHESKETAGSTHSAVVAANVPPPPRGRRGIPAASRAAARACPAPRPRARRLEPAAARPRRPPWRTACGGSVGAAAGLVLPDDPVGVADLRKGEGVGVPSPE
eukprot:CAMPEP_0179281030 /NCGR_PEP_ID=MMETSP0797-20121207/36935_1 /TAXON_ID=47934 /ORGANISM="Dinophysis acuminata, Strain DAEP01" /LENGTH=119 /DNA_ID=CAMNT_0020989709 /DNA_START=364 /DNA_END=724 /DNA_ORIENTATION=+